MTWSIFWGNTITWVTYFSAIAFKKTHSGFAMRTVSRGRCPAPLSMSQVYIYGLSYAEIEVDKEVGETESVIDHQKYAACEMPGCH